jgi:hypothetical protein
MMSNPKLTAMSSNPLDHPLIWRSLIMALTSVIVSGDYAAIHDALVIEKFCNEFDVSLSAVSERLETYIHASPEGIN